MDEVCITILDFCRSEFVLLKPLYDKIPRSTIYLHLKNELQKDKLIDKRGNKYKATARGIEILNKSNRNSIGTGIGKKSSSMNKRSLIMPGEEEEKPLNEQVKSLLGEISNNPLDRDVNLLSLKSMLDQEKISIKELKEFIKVHKILKSNGLNEKIALSIGEELAKYGPEVKVVINKVIPELEEFDDLTTAINKSIELEDELLSDRAKLKVEIDQLEHVIITRGSTPERIGELQNLDSILKNAGIEPDIVKSFVQQFQDLLKIGFTSGSAYKIAKELENIGLEIPDGIRKIIRYINEAGTLERKINELNTSINEKTVFEELLSEKIEELKLKEKILENNIKELFQKQAGAQIKLNEQLSSIRTNEQIISAQRMDIVSLNMDIHNRTQVRAEGMKIYSVNSELMAKKKKLLEDMKKVDDDLQALMKRYAESSHDIQAYKAWHNYLMSGQLPLYDRAFFKDIELLLEIHRGKAKMLEPHTDQINCRVWEKIVRYHKEFVEKHIVSNYEKLRKDYESMRNQLLTLTNNSWIKESFVRGPVK